MGHPTELRKRRWPRLAAAALVATAALGAVGVAEAGAAPADAATYGYCSSIGQYFDANLDAHLSPAAKEAIAWSWSDWGCYYHFVIVAASDAHWRVRFVAPADHPANVAADYGFAHNDWASYYAWMEAVGNVYHLRLVVD
jgi:hypothetical protein